MAKLKAPLLSFGASGAIAKSVVYFPWKGVNAARQYVVPANPRSDPQQTQRGYLTAATNNWHANASTDAARIAWNRYAGVLAAIMTGFNAACKTFIAQSIAEAPLRVNSDVQTSLPTANGFTIPLENSTKTRTIQARIGTSKTHFPTTVPLVDDDDDTYSLAWDGGAPNTLYYFYLEVQLTAVWYRISGIYQQKSGAPA